MKNKLIDVGNDAWDSAKTYTAFVWGYVQKNLHEPDTYFIREPVFSAFRRGRPVIFLKKRGTQPFVREY
ncbi:hypothetical protein [Pelotomaculum sp. FP]|uniref:hypothetical protein n=1 Tax=Pelotomaculum sp. FP TaxID=261474 RepID=UPI0012913244|nr:hypothetical protein [Pelotomaculum sp. FP]